MNEKQVLETVTTFETEIYPLFNLIRDEATHINAFLSKEISMDKEFLPKGVKKRYSGEKASWDSILFLKRIGCLTDLIMAKKINNYYTELNNLPENELNSVKSKVWEITTRESNVYVERYVKDVHRYVNFGSINNQLHQFINFKMKQLEGSSSADIKKEVLKDIKQRIDSHSNMDLVNLSHHITKTEKYNVETQGEKKTINKVLGILVDFYMDLHLERTSLQERYFVLLNRTLNN